jgi:predicted lipid carrier protein YhbT
MPTAAPGLCRFITKPLSWLPPRLHAGGLSLVLNHLLAHSLAGDEMDFLRGKVVSLDVTDLGIRYHLMCKDGGFVPAAPRVEADVRFSGTAHAFLLLAAQREDADSLFFARLLRIEGDTATGLHLKNFLDALGQPPLPSPARHVLERFTDLYGRRCGAAAQSPRLDPGATAL